MTTQISQMLAQIGDLSRTHPRYFNAFEDTCLESAPREELVKLMASAPTDSVKFYLLGRYNSRVALAAVTGRAFV